MKLLRAKVRSLKLSDERGYELLAKLVDGPINMIDRYVKIEISSEQLTKVSLWEPPSSNCVLPLE